jgi:predicted NAD/FAD-dependent oxidoreductase
MVMLEKKLDVDWVGAFVHHSPIRWIARNGTKPMRPDGREYLVVHADSDWTAARWDDSPEAICDQLWEAFKTAIGTVQLADVAVVSTVAHRWKYSIADSDGACPVERCYFNDDRSVIACGDWAGGSRVEGALISGMAAAGVLMGGLFPAAVADSGAPVQSMLF